MLRSLTSARTEEVKARGADFRLLDLPTFIWYINVLALKYTNNYYRAYAWSIVCFSR